MEKLKIKHDHTLTDILKVAIFGLFLILPILMFLPNCLYYAFNEHAQVNTTTEPVYEYKNVDFNQIIPLRNGSRLWYDLNVSVSVENENIHVYGTSDYVSGDPNNYDCFNNIQAKLGHKYYCKSTSDIFALYTYGAVPSSPSQSSYITTAISNVNIDFTIRPYNNELIASGTEIDDTFQCMLVDLTQMFGSGNEPTLQEFETLYPNEYYNYTLSKKEILTIDTGETVTVTETTKNIEYAWKSLWEGPILTWTNNNNFIFTINLFTQIFAISQESYLTNYLTYILTITAIYLIFDIVFVLITKLTHLINNK